MHPREVQHAREKEQDIDVHRLGQSVDLRHSGSAKRASLQHVRPDPRDARRTFTKEDPSEGTHVWTLYRCNLPINTETSPASQLGKTLHRDMS
jgi:hypothetical protein